MDTTGHNIANVNTDGYSRQRVDFATRSPTSTGAQFVGGGVQTARIARQYDDFLANQMRASQSVASGVEAYYSGAKRLDDLLADPDLGLQPALQGFFDAVQGMADDPTSVASRQVVLSQGQTLVDRFHQLDGELDRSRDHNNDQLRSTADEINGIANNLAKLNNDLALAYGSSDTALPNDLLDQRDQLINDLSKLVDVQVVPQTDGALNVFIGKGQALVMDATAAQLTTQPSGADPGRLDLVFNFSSGAQVVTDQLTGGRIGGLIRLRDELIDPAQNRLGLAALGIASQLNGQHRLGLDLDGQPGGDLFSQGSVQVLQPPGNGSSITVAYNDIGQLTGDDYQLFFDGSNFLLTRQSDGSLVDSFPNASASYVREGLSIDIDVSGSPAKAGDSFEIRPVRNGAQRLGLLVDGVRKLAAASPLQSRPAMDANGNPANSGHATISQPVVTSSSGLPLGATPLELVYGDNAGGPGVPGFTILNGPAPPNDFLPYDPASESGGKTFPLASNPGQFDAFGGMSFTISGIPKEPVAGAGDRFIIGDNRNGASDNRNALALAGLKQLHGLLGGNATFEDVYSQTVSDIGAKTHHAEVSLSAQQGLLERSKAALDQVSGVNLDEEAAKLIQFQQAYQASAQMISVSNTLFDSLLGAVGR